MRSINKRGIELSVNFLVIFILAIITFALGIYIVRQYFSGASESILTTQTELEQRISNLLCDIRDKVCVSNNYQKINGGKSIVIGIHIYNYLNEKAEFSINVVRAKAYDVNDNEMNWDNDLTQAFFPSKSIPPKQQDKLGVQITSAKNAKKGKYVFYVTVSNNKNTESIKEQLVVYVV